MATRRIQTLLSRYCSTGINNPNPFFHPIYKTLIPHLIEAQFKSIQTLTPAKSPDFQAPFSSLCRNFCSNNRINNGDDEDDDADDDDDEDDEESEAEESEHLSGKSDEEKAQEAEEIGYKVIGPLSESDHSFKPYEPVFAVVQIGSHQFKVSNGDSIFTEKLKYCDVNDKLILNRVLMLGSKTQTMIGRPVLPDAAVHAVVEEHALDAKVIVFKKKRRKNYRRTKGHRQELTKLRITDIQGIEKPEIVPPLKSEKKAAKKVEKVPVAA